MVAKQLKNKPKKPSKGFPLYAHPNGQWCKTLKGQKHYFGTWDDPQSALKAWKEFEAKHVLGMQPKNAANSGGASLVDMVTGFLDDKQQKVDRGNLSPRTLNQYVIAGRWLVEGVGRHRLIETIGPTDFTKLRNLFPAKWGTVFSDARIMHVRTMFKWAYDNDVIDRPVKYGSNWSKTPKKQVRLEQAKKPVEVTFGKSYRRVVGGPKMATREAGFFNYGHRQKLDQKLVGVILAVGELLGRAAEGAGWRATPDTDIAR